MEYPPRIYDFTLHIVGLIVGAALIVGHLYALMRTAETQKWLIKLPRSKSAGIGILALDAVWCFWLVSCVDLEEFGWLRVYLQVVLAYIWLTLGMFWVGKPYLLRDQINWITKSVLRWRALSGLGVLWGALIFSLALFAY